MTKTPLEIAEYIIDYYSYLLSAPETLALKHYRWSIKLNEKGTEQIPNAYYQAGRLSNDRNILKYLDKGYMQFVIYCADRILNEAGDQVYLNFCPACKKLARTPFAKQCRYCNHSWRT